jgi:hypothetical protein
LYRNFICLFRLDFKFVYVVRPDGGAGSEVAGIGFVLDGAYAGKARSDRFTNI